jgi:hypothetical protein
MDGASAVETRSTRREWRDRLCTALQALGFTAWVSPGSAEVHCKFDNWRVSLQLTSQCARVEIDDGFYGEERPSPDQYAELCRQFPLIVQVAEQYDAAVERREVLP